MAIDLINVGAVANDGTGDPDRSAWLKVNGMFTELYNRCPDLLVGLIAADGSSHNYRNATMADISFAGQANGLATLDGSARLPVAQLPSNLVGNNITGTIITAAQPDITSLGTLTGLAINGSLTFGSASDRIIGDLSNTTHSQRLLIQGSTANNSSILGIIPNGTGTTSGLNLYTNSNPDAAQPLLQLQGTPTGINIISGITAGGTYEPLNFYTNGTAQIQVGVNGVTTFNNTTNSTNYATGAVVIDGGLGVGLDLQVGGKVNVQGTINALTAAGNGIGTAGVSWIGLNQAGTVNASGGSGSGYQNLTSINAIANGDSLMGCMLNSVLGAGAFTGVTTYQLYIGGSSNGSTNWAIYSNSANPSYLSGGLTVGSTASATSTSAGASVVAGGLAVAKNIAVGANTGFTQTNRLIEARVAHAVSQDDSIFLGSDGGSGVGRCGIALNYARDASGNQSQYLGVYISDARYNLLQLKQAQLLVGSAAQADTQSAAIISTRGEAGGSAFEWGHQTAGLGCTLGHQAAGNSFIAFYGEAGTTSGYRARGYNPTVITSTGVGDLTIANCASTSLDNQSPTTLVAISAAGNVSIPSTTNSTSSTTGCLTLSGGLGVAGAVYIGGALHTAAISATSFNIGSTSEGAVLGAASASVTASFDCSAAASSGTNLTVDRTVGDGNAIGWFRNGSLVATVSMTTTAVSYNTTSDARLKTDQQTFDGAAIIEALKPYNFEWRATGERAHGVFAQETESVYPEAVTYSEHHDHYGVDYSKFVPVLLRAMQQAQDRIAKLEATIH